MAIDSRRFDKRTEIPQSPRSAMPLASTEDFVPVVGQITGAGRSELSGHVHSKNVMS
jgi:hypothetical protein